ncbi:MAG: 50S ribosomal protein L15 [Candidatus Buchananbacteria bacterium RIFCSPHIGHO2_01_FULL_47_11b]|uniref:Large ribosomal subunit protein uL15 n=1 Tax=Candidatus Buchananbacteria bacterium RIFCSPHIGHO2_01_FULL_47_11b TaxID=1797537 RepID=A0A1G1Y465_9BACT|nr:MAG: 50S ribosomal protein L15 [Candidatus Buchananbacteria bacterium RIFCSPHIGHO2_01_FULL_47_11b]
MSVSLHNLKPNKGSIKKKKRVGRGNASGHGTYSTRGQKGQRSRAGGSGGLFRRGITQLLRNKPKLGGFTSPYPKLQAVNIGLLERTFESGEVVTAKKLLEKNIIKSVKPGIKILGDGKLTKKLTVQAAAFSKTAEKAIVEAGGTAKIATR